jgi:hypothetical protein
MMSICACLDGLRVLRGYSIIINLKKRILKFAEGDLGGRAALKLSSVSRNGSEESGMRVIFQLKVPLERRGGSVPEGETLNAVGLWQVSKWNVGAWAPDPLVLQFEWHSCRPRNGISSGIERRHVLSVSINQDVETTTPDMLARDAALSLIDFLQRELCLEATWTCITKSKGFRFGLRVRLATLTLANSESFYKFSFIF